MKRINLRDVPDETYQALATGAKAKHQSLNTFVVGKLAEAAAVLAAEEYLESYIPPQATGITTDDAVAAVREVRHAS
ncbi:MAG: hypothetical protein ACRDRN_11690 [Sciscionella sp.]